jgi:arylformamidase
MDLDAEYDNRARVPEHPDIFSGWARDAAAYRAAHASLAADIAYGTHERQRVDIFGAEDGPASASEKPLIMFIHGGYWKTLDRSLFSHLAAGANAHGFDVAIPSYRLAPETEIAGIISDIRNACLFLWKKYKRRLVVCGHSAGGHLAACMLATDWPAAGGPERLVASGLGISGLYDLRPLIPTSVNDVLNLNDQTARTVSPLLWPAPAAGSRFQAWVGSHESDEYLRQSQTLAACWTGAGVDCAWRASPGDNHFTVVRHLSGADSDMTKAVVNLSNAP